MHQFIAGILAGYGIAIPVGAIAILIVETGLRRGFWAAFAAGAGAATADFLYALLAALAGTALEAALRPYEAALRLASACVLIALGCWGLWRVTQKNVRAGGKSAVQMPVEKTGCIYAQFVGLTVLNPLTVAYFAALILGGSSALAGWLDRIVFVFGAGLSSLSWQSLLAGVGALGRRHFSPRLQTIASVAGNLIVAGLGVSMFF